MCFSLAAPTSVSCHHFLFLPSTISCLSPIISAPVSSRHSLSPPQTRLCPQMPSSSLSFLWFAAGRRRGLQRGRLRIKQSPAAPPRSAVCPPAASAAYCRVGGPNSGSRGARARQPTTPAEVHSLCQVNPLRKPQTYNKTRHPAASTVQPVIVCIRLFCLFFVYFWCSSLCVWNEFLALFF